MLTVFLSHPFEATVPVYGNPEARPEITPVKSMAAGDSANTFFVKIENHWGTHIDGPAHFIEGGRRIADYPAEFWRFVHPQVVDLPAEPNKLIDIQLLNGKIDDRTDFLILKTGFQHLRKQPEYSLNNPGVKAEVGEWLRAKFPSVRVIGFDFVSLSSFQNREEGRRSHLAFLGGGTGHEILIVEDMNLDYDCSRLKEVWIAPLRVSAIDSAPCTIIGILD